MRTMDNTEQRLPNSVETREQAPAATDRAMLSSAAERALQEAAARRQQREAQPTPPERGGRGGLEPVRYGDWEVKGLASDF